MPEWVRDDHHVIFTGPTLAALFHEQSKHCNLEKLDRVYLLHQTKLDRPDSQPYLKEVIERIITARNQAGAKIDGEKIQWVPIEGIEDPTNHEQIMKVLAKWIDSDDDPFDLTMARIKRHIEINLSPGTSSMHACWTMLHWSGKFKDSTVMFFQGDSCLFVGKIEDDQRRAPLRYVAFDVLTRWVRGPEVPNSQQKPDQDHGVSGCACMSLSVLYRPMSW